MKVIFKKTDEIKEVADGYARNYLLPQGLVTVATEEEIKRLENKKQEAERQKEERKLKKIKEVKTIKNKLKDKTIGITGKVGRKGKLYGAVTADILAKKLGVQEEEILLDKPIKRVGEYEVELKLGEKKTKIKVVVSPEEKGKR
jgi:large subunit ribosomal protein L9